MKEDDVILPGAGLSRGPGRIGKSTIAASRERNLFGREIEPPELPERDDDRPCDCDTRDLALDEAKIGPARVQLLWFDRCETILTTIAEVPNDEH